MKGQDNFQNTTVNNNFRSKSYSQTSPNGHLSTRSTFLCPGGPPAHSVLFEVLPNGHLSTTATAPKVCPQPGADLGGGCRGCAPPPPEMTCGFLIQLVFCKKKTMWFIGVEVEQETSASPPKKILDPPLSRGGSRGRVQGVRTPP